MAGLAAAFGSGAMTNTISDIETADVILVTGSNTTENHPVLSSFIKRAVTQRGAKLIVIDPRRIKLTGFAEYWLRQNLGSDVAWINGMMNVIISEDLHDKKFIKNRTEGFEELKETVEKYTPEYTEKITGIPAQQLIEAARLYAKANAGSICYCMGITQHIGGTDNVKSLDQCLHSLIRSAGGDGNLLFNVGPKPDGRIEPLQVERLKEMGEWLKTYGYSIYGTRGGPFKPTDWGVSTRKENSIYLHLINWMGNAPEIIIPDIGMKIISCKLTDGSELTLKKREGGYSVQIPGDLLQPINTVIELVADGNVMEIQPMEIPSQSRSFKREVKASSNPNPHWGDVSNINNGDWFGHPWRPAEDDENPWVEIDFGKPEEISKAIIYEQGEKIESFVMQYFSDGKWVKLFEGEKIGSKAEFEFNPVETQQVRMVINEFTKGLNLYEIIIL